MISFLFIRFQLLTLLLCITIAVCVNGQSRRVRIRPRPIQQQPEEERDIDAEIAEEDNTPQPAIQYYTASQAREEEEGQGRLVLVADDDYNGLYGRPNSGGARARADYVRPAAKSSTIAPRRKESESKEPPVQTIRNYSKVNDDGSFTFGYEAADGSFKEETRGTDCVVRGKYGYIDPDGNKREFTYVSGNPCDPNNPNEEEEKEEEESNEPENVPINFPRRPSARPIQHRPVQTTTAAPTTVFQNQYSSAAYSDEDDEPEDSEQEQPEQIQLLQQRPRISSRPQSIAQPPPPQEVAIRQRPRVSYINTTPAPLYTQTTPSANSVSITPRPSYRIQAQNLQAQPPATTYRPQVQFFTQKPAQLQYSKPVHHVPLPVEPITKSAYASTRKPIDFTAELAKFQQEHNAVTTTIAPRPQPVQKAPTTAPIYQTQLVFDPSTGQYAQSLVPQGHHHQSQYLHSNQFEQPQQVTLEQLQNRPAAYQRPQSPSTPRSPLQFPQFNQQVYQKENENLQVLNSQQLFAQQQHLQQQQLHQDRLEASKRLQTLQSHRFQLAQSQSAPIRQLPANQQQQQHPGFYYVQQPHHPTLFH